MFDRSHRGPTREPADHCNTKEPACCVPFCPLGDPVFQCPGVTECLPFFEAGLAPPGLENVGVCHQQV